MRSAPVGSAAVAPPTAVPWGDVALVTLAACVLAPVGDWTHVASGTTVYDWDPGPHVGRSAWWFVLCIAGLASTAAVVASWLEGRRPPERARPDGVLRVRAAVTMVGVTVIYVSSSLLTDAPVGLTTLLLGGAAVALWAAADGTVAGLLMGAGVAVAGCAGEAVISAAGMFHYAPAHDGMLGVPPWLLAIHFSFGVAIVALLRALGDATPQDRSRG